MPPFSDDRSWRTSTGWPVRRLRWYEDVLALHLASTCRHLDREVLGLLILEMQPQPDRFTRRVPTATFRGRGYAAWEWALAPATIAAYVEANVPRIEDEVAAARWAVRCAEAAARFPTLDAWLAAERTGQLPEAVPQEASGVDLLAGAGLAAQARALWDAQRDRERRWPRVCRDCGAEYTREDRWNTVRCAPCLARRKGASHA